MHAPRSFVVLAIGIGIGMAAGIVTAQSTKQLKQARKVLAKLKLVDGPGSGLDADTVQGKTPTQLLAEVTAGPTGPTGPQGPPGAGGLVVRDVNGALVGAVIGPTFPDDPPCGLTPPSECDEAGATPVARKIGSNVVQFNVDGQRLRLGKDFIPNSLAFESNDCTGTPLVLISPSVMMGMAWAEADVFYYAILPATPRTFHSAAFFLTDGSPCAFVTLPGGRCCVPKTIEGKRAADVATLDLHALGLVPPFHVEGP